MPGITPLSPAAHDTFEAMVADGCTTSEIADHFRVSVRTVQRWKANGLPNPDNWRDDGGGEAALAAEVVALRQRIEALEVGALAAEVVALRQRIERLEGSAEGRGPVTAGP